MPSMMPVLWNSQVTSVQRRVVWIQASPGWRVISEPMAKANGTANPTYPRYSMGGWMAMAGYCSSGLSPWPSCTGGDQLVDRQHAERDWR